MRSNFSNVFLSKGVNYLTGDLPFTAMLRYIGFVPGDDMRRLGRYVSETLIESATYIDHYARPILRTWGLLDERTDEVWLSPDHRRVLGDLQDFGVVRKAIESGSLLSHFASAYIISDSGLFCTLTLTLQTAYALKKYGSPDLKEKYLGRFTDTESPWYGATYYSEIQGGSDLGSNRTVAQRRESGWIISGNDKYFASDAGIADGAVVTARIEGAPEGVKGISIFFVPATDSNGRANYRIRRLKEKLGTVAVPTGEVEFERSEGYLLGDERNGIYHALEILAISRIDDALAAAGMARKALWEAYRYASRRMAFGKRLIEHPLLLRDFAELEADLEGALMLSLLAAKRFDESCEERPPYTDAYHFARMLMHMAKNLASASGAEITRYAMEIIGGKGFLTEFPVEKFHRDEIVTSIWEGTTNIQALDMLELLLRKRTHLSLFSELETIAARLGDREDRTRLYDAIDEARAKVERMLGSANPQFYAKDILNTLALLTASVHMFAAAHAEGNSLLRGIASLFFTRHVNKGEIDPSEFLQCGESLKWMGEG
ncbi:MAG: acyl-CoA dehydrogenase family protein [Thermoplasmata archaeon YP2-bin.285]|uniref:Acyl-CoA dehydrogenase family protein n=1 Tax=Candidatus Sysuiplasma superficiale TaxID=2823368 RepID=A0A8J7YL39_9ARCH|nr:acyl-CoA dehydrogenase family protein [Candidatus Sysuiplasma superficiale]